MSKNLLFGFGLLALGTLPATCAAGGTSAAEITPPPAASGAFKVGFLDGCNTGRFDDGSPANEYVRDDNAYAADAAYRQGWDSGEIACYNDERTHPRMGNGK